MTFWVIASPREACKMARNTLLTTRSERLTLPMAKRHEPYDGNWNHEVAAACLMRGLEHMKPSLFDLR
jgi:hypothetical protein